MDEDGGDNHNEMKKTRNSFDHLHIKTSSSSLHHDHQNRRDDFDYHLDDDHQSVYDDSSSSSDSGELQPTRKLHLKLKIPVGQSGTADKEDHRQQPPPPPPPVRKHFCELCNKEFRSGKAFGGHVRIHSSDDKKKKKKKVGVVVGNSKNKNKNKNKKTEKERDLIRADVEGKIRCCLCGKEFQTMHSLFGHMRRHPERSWKGIRPPQPQPHPQLQSNLLGRTVPCSSSSSEKFKFSSCSSILDDNDHHNLNDDDVMSSTPSIMEEATEDVHEAACCLMMLYSNASNTYSATITKPKPEVKKFVDNNLIIINDNNGDTGMTVDMKIKMEIELSVNPRDDDHRMAGEAKCCDDEKGGASSILGFDLNRPPNEENGNGWFQI